MVNQIELYLAFDTWLETLVTKRFFLQKKLSLNLVKILEKNLKQNEEGALWTFL